jgi:signal transduction histidine kinase
MEQCDIPESWWKTLKEPKPSAFILLILTGLFLELVVHYYLQISVVYTHFYYLVIALAGLWYGRKAIWIALFFGGLHLVISYAITGAFSPDTVLRAAMFCIVAFVIGTIAEQMKCFNARIIVQNQELQDLNDKLGISHAALKTANKKLSLLSGISRHDIRNQLISLMGFIELSKAKITDPELLHFIEREEEAAESISRQIEFTKNYEMIGVLAPQWQNLATVLEALQSGMSGEEIGISIEVGPVEIFADPMLEKVFLNLADNSRRHGEHVRQISISQVPSTEDSLVIAYEDDGGGVPPADKERIFEKGFGRHTGLGLFLSREILAITGLTIRETGIYGRGVRFEILVPVGKYRSPGS